MGKVISIFDHVTNKEQDRIKTRLEQIQILKKQVAELKYSIQNFGGSNDLIITDLNYYYYKLSQEEFNLKE